MRWRGPLPRRRQAAPGSRASRAERSCRQDGPASRPCARSAPRGQAPGPTPIASAPPTNFTGMMRNGACGNCPLRTASTCGMPLPTAWGGFGEPADARGSRRDRASPDQEPEASSPAHGRDDKRVAQAIRLFEQKHEKGDASAGNRATTSASAVKDARLPPSSTSPAAFNSEIIRKRRFQPPEGEKTGQKPPVRALSRLGAVSARQR